MLELIIDEESKKALITFLGFFSFMPLIKNADYKHKTKEYGGNLIKQQLIVNDKL